MSNHFSELLLLQQLQGVGVVKINEKYAGFLPTCGSVEDIAALTRNMEKKLTKEEIRQAQLNGSGNGSCNTVRSINKNYNDI